MIHIGSIYKDGNENYYLNLGKDNGNPLVSLLLNIKSHKIKRCTNLEIKYYFELIS